MTPGGRALVHHPIAAQRERNARIRAQAEQIAAATSVEYTTTIPVAVVPANTRETTRLPARTRRVFLERLARRIRTTFVVPNDTAETATISTAVFDTAPSETPAAARILDLSCATCRGECCTAGGDHAFLREDSLTRVHAQQPTLNEDALLATYASHLPTRHYRGSCVYHTTLGCALPRPLRSNLCNRYLCGGLTQLKRALESTEGAVAFVAAADTVHLRRMSLITPSGAKSVAFQQRPRTTKKQ